MTNPWGQALYFLGALAIPANARLVLDARAYQVRHLEIWVEPVLSE